MNRRTKNRATRLGHRLLQAGALLVLLLLPLQAQERPLGVVELFTSQGCSACPPADAFFAELADRSDLVALSYHVDYWDYLGWKDELGTPENTVRQRAYSDALRKAFYTPQMIVNGSEQFVGSHRAKVERAITAGTGRALAVDVALSSADGSVLVDIGAAGDVPRGVHVILVSYKPQKVVTIGGGDNEGKTVDYRNIVTDYQTLGMWHGEALRIELPKSELRRKGGHNAVLLQVFDEDGLPGRILGAARTPAYGW